jgi:hypothetical protein
MKRSEVVNRISDNVLSSFFPSLSLQHKNLIADCMLAEVEKLGMCLCDEDGRVPYEPEEGWDAYFTEQDRKDHLRDFSVTTDVTRGSKVAQQFLDGKEFDELADEHNVTRERIRQIVCKYRKKYLKGKE